VQSGSTFLGSSRPTSLRIIGSRAVRQDSCFLGLERPGIIRVMLIAASALTPLLRGLDPERAHKLALWATRHGLAGRDSGKHDATISTRAFGLNLRSPIGLAAGFDKDGVAVDALGRLGFGFIETGTITLRPQAGNPRPRLFRLPEDQALINRLGFNNAGLEAYISQLSRSQRIIPIGANIGLNKLEADPERDYSALAAAIAPFVDYIVINVSSPNTPGLRDLQDETRLGTLLRAVAAGTRSGPPLLVKLAPDLPIDTLAAIVEVCVDTGIQGLVISNTTIARPAGLRSPHGREAGGLSGQPLFALSTAMLARVRLLARGRLMLIGVGGVSTAEQALTKLKAGASLVQLYTALVYQGPGLVARLNRELGALLRREGFAHVRDAVGVEAERLARWGAWNTFAASHRSATDTPASSSISGA
jgi:dihydroorotate dehydrogenase